ncbi:unnamed protein product [Schistosoma curassoni]|uniref:Ovule protein n=1 Tax=Schistosoma curassoni TaxID=6186 RepID=A0A183KM45_9TREM|nr:unnamed protein product [Schistosoma curassoni]
MRQKKAKQYCKTISRQKMKLFSSRSLDKTESDRGLLIVNSKSSKAS